MRYIISGLTSFFLAGCTIWSLQKEISYGLEARKDTLNLGKSELIYKDYQALNPLISPIIKFENGVQIAMNLGGIYKEGSMNAESFKNLSIEFYMASTRENILFDVSDIKFIDNQGKEKPVLLSLEYFTKPYRINNKLIDVVIPKPLSEKFYQNPTLKLPKRIHKAVRNNFFEVTEKSKIVQGYFVVKDTNVYGENGFFRIVFPFIEKGIIRKYTVYFYPLEYQVPRTFY